MSSRRIQNSLARLDVTRKWILLGCVAIALSTVLPWYADLDAFGAGDLYLGLTGPLFLVGLMVFASAVFIGTWILLPAFGKRLPTLPVKEGALFVLLGFQDLLLLLIANSVFFHPKFGVNITLKETGFGMILAFAGVLLTLWSSYRLFRRGDRRAEILDQEEGQEPFLRAPEPAHRPMMDRPPSYARPSTGMPMTGRREPLERPHPDDRPAPQPLRMDL